MLNSPGVIGGSGDKQLGGEMLPLGLQDNSKGCCEKEKLTHGSLNSFRGGFKLHLIHFFMEIIFNMMSIQSSNVLIVF